MSKEIKTSIIIKASPARVWQVLTRFETYPQWNPFIKSLEGDVSAGKKITVHIVPPGTKGMVLKPKVLVFDTIAHQLKWKGKLLIGGLFDGTHNFQLIANADGTTNLIQSEQFNGILIPFLKKMLDNNTVDGFNQMNEKVKELAENVLP